ncbi:non-ribosomal peptide synthetase [Streptomyces sp. ST2-7A]|uniref:non-ribosomal peptide synthetase n=1 Tax=Streptomyces sp. ST2-7A TaxID=2907214 RepID=UPI001F1CA1B0|nr:non-ribosomal peptide synthetase [Streptomyces sp. ST2-7A]MCE7082629.1 amino acid adenylation domain-containing protein [Streptomyces sp. ST2-7A]
MKPDMNDFFPTSSAQQRLWFLQQRHPDSRAYTVTEAVWLRGRIDVDTLERAVAAVVGRHDQLRAVFEYGGDDLTQRVLPREEQPFRLARAVTSRENLPRWFAEETAVPFDLVRGPVYRTTLLELGEEEWVLAFCVHHIVTDGWSAELFFADLSSAYCRLVDGDAPFPGEVLRDVPGSAPGSYREAVVEERRRMGSPGFVDRVEAAAGTVAGASFALDLPVNATAATEPAPAATHRVRLPDTLVRRVEERATEYGMTPFMLYAAAYTALLSRWTGRDEVVFGLPAAGREDTATHTTYGLFVNTLPLRARVAAGDTWNTLLGRVRDAALEAYAHADVPLDRLIAHRGGTPLQALLVVQPDEMPLPRIPGVEAARWLVDHHHTKFDLLLQIDRGQVLAPDVAEPGHRTLVTLEFRADSLAPEPTARMLAHWRHILETMVAVPDARVADLEPDTPVDRELRESACRLSEAPVPLDPIAAFERGVAEHPKAPAVWIGGEALDYAGLASRVGAIQAALEVAGVGPGDFVGVCLRRTPDLVAALMAVFRRGAAYVPLDSGHPRERLRFVVRDARCRVVLVEPATRDAPPPDTGPFLDVTSAPAVPALPGAVPVEDEHIAYLIHTSGSTGRPKGVAIPHRALRSFLGWARNHFAPGDLSVVLAGTSVGFDLSVFEIFLPLSVGGALRLVENALQLTEQPGREPTLINTVPSAMTELLRAGALPEGVRVVNLAGEPLPRTLVDTLHEQSDSLRVFNLYGPSEDTTYSTWHEVPRGGVEEPLIGVPIAGTNAYVLDDRLTPVPAGADGELFLGGSGVARGYLDRPGLTAERFLPDPFCGAPGARMYRTGDRVRLTESGELSYRGRYDHQVKLRGFRIETGEIESRARALGGVTQALVVLREVADTPHLVCYWTGGAEPDAVRTALADELPAYMVPRYWVRLDAFPLNANGKIDRAALPAPVRDTGDATEPATPSEREVAAVMAELTRSGPLGPDADFFALGGHSLLAMRLMTAIRDRLGVEITLSDVFRHRTVGALAARIDLLFTREVTLPPLRPRDGDDSAPLAFAQERMWLVEQLRPGSPMLNIGVAVRIRGDLDRSALERSLRTLTDRHEALRLRIDRGANGELRQRAVAPRQALLRDLTARNEEATGQLLREALADPFDLATEDPARWLLVEEPAGPDSPPRHVLALVIHHVVADAWSIRLLMDELFADYATVTAGGSPSSARRLSALDHATWQRRHLDRPAVTRRDLAHWRERLTDLPERLRLAFDHPPAQAVSYRGARVTRRLSGEAVETLLGIGRESGATAFMTVLALYQGLMSRLTGQDDIVVGTPIANRDQAGTEGLVGCLLNTLAIRTDHSGVPSFREAVEQTRRTCLDAFAHQQTPFELVVSALGTERTVEHTPVFQTMFVLDGTAVGAPSVSGLDCTEFAVPPVATQYDITLMVGRDAEGWHASWDYRADLFEAGTVAGYADCFETLLEQAGRHPDRPLRRLPLCTPARERTALERSRPAAAPAPATLTTLFAERVAADPDAPALHDDEGVLTYRELDLASERLGARIAARGVRPDDRVVVVLPRSRASVITLLAVAKGGAAFLCLDPALPTERMRWIARDAGVRLQVTDAAFADRLPPDLVPAVRMDTEPSAPVAPLPERNPATPDHLAYVIYTSGSTGKPKGVALTHGGLAQLRDLHRDRLEAGPGARVLQYAPYSFDASVWECVMGLLTGACLHLTHPDRLLPGAPLEATLAERGITHLTMPPSNLAMLRTLPDSLRHLVLAGEACPAELIRRWGDRVHLWNAYGPSEATVCGTIQDCSGLPARRAPSIGTAFPGAEAYVLDEALNVVPPSVPGELYLGGGGLARGYLNRPELTAERFLPHPHTTTPGERLYRTGDLARLTATGEIEFLGRADDQIKLRGIRVEPGEIERALAGLDPRIADTAVLVAGSGGDQHLLGFVAGPADLDLPVLRDGLLSALPAYMVPARLERLDSFPLTGNGKLDRGALARIGEERRQRVRSGAPPRGPLEQEIAAMWREVLPDAEIGREDSFFAIGGTSLTLTRLHERIDSRHPGAIKLVDLFRLNTVSAIAGALKESGAVASVAADLSFRL